jgi:hypothetical protein
MENNIIIPMDIQNEAREYGIEAKKAANLLGNLPQLKTERLEYERQFNEVIRLDIDAPDTPKRAKELRLKIKENRTKGIMVWHKHTKDYFLKGGQFVDAIKRKEEAINVKMEYDLEQIENYQEYKKQKEQDELRQKRLKEMQPYLNEIGNTPTIDFGLISEEEYQSHYEFVKFKYEQKIQKEKEEERQRLELERFLQKVKERKNRLLPYYHFIPDFDELDFKNMSDADVDALIAKAESIKETQRLEAEAAKQKAREAEAALEAERKKIAAERSAMLEKMQQERIEKEKLELEIRRKNAEEERKRKEELQKEAELKNASDKVLLYNFSQKVRNLYADIPEVKGERAANKLDAVQQHLDAILNILK